MKILIADDNEDICDILASFAEGAGFEVATAADGREALDLALQGDVSLLLLDVMMPKLDGFEVCREIRRVSDLPIIMITARGEDYDRIMGLELGADDYVVKPFSPKELMARVAAVLARRKASENQAPSAELVSGGLVVNKNSRTVTIDGKRIDVTLKEYELLVYLMENKNIALSRDKLLQDIWGYDFFGDDRTIDTHIKNLRGRLGDYRDKIATVRGIGYKFED